MHCNANAHEIAQPWYSYVRLSLSLLQAHLYLLNLHRHLRLKCGAPSYHLQQSGTQMAPRWHPNVGGSNCFYDGLVASQTCELYLFHCYSIHRILSTTSVRLGEYSASTQKRLVTDRSSGIRWPPERCSLTAARFGPLVFSFRGATVG